MSNLASSSKDRDSKRRDSRRGDPTRGDQYTTDDAFLGGRLRVLQSKSGYRAGLDAVMLAAAVPARPGERIVEAGIGAGAAALCLASRIGGLAITGIEIEAGAAALARRNAARNGFAETIKVLEADLARPGDAMRALGLEQASFDHAMANPPFYARAAARLPADPGKARAHMRDGELLERWMRLCAGLVRARGTITMILPAALLAEAMALFAGRTGALAIFPLFPREGAAASRVIIQGVKGSRAAPRLMPGLVLHGMGSDFTPQAEAILRHGRAIEALAGAGIT